MIRPPPGSTPAQNSVMSALHGESVLTPPAKAGVAIAALPSRRAQEKPERVPWVEGTAAGAAGFAAAGAAAGGVPWARAEPVRTPTPKSTKRWNRMAIPRAHDEPDGTFLGPPANGKYNFLPTPDFTSPPLELLSAIGANSGETCAGCILVAELWCAKDPKRRIASGGLL